MPLAFVHSILSSLRLNHIEPPGVLLLGLVLIFAVVEFFVLPTRRRARSNERHAAWTHAGLVVAGATVAALIYGASWIAVGPWQPTNGAPSEQSAVPHEASPQPSP